MSVPTARSPLARFRSVVYALMFTLHFTNVPTEWRLVALKYRPGSFNEYIHYANRGALYTLDTMPETWFRARSLLLVKARAVVAAHPDAWTLDNPSEPALKGLRLSGVLPDGAPVVEFYIPHDVDRITQFNSPAYVGLWAQREDVARAIAGSAALLDFFRTFQAVLPCALGAFYTVTCPTRPARGEKTVENVLPPPVWIEEHTEELEIVFCRPSAIDRLVRLANFRCHREFPPVPIDPSSPSTASSRVTLSPSHPSESSQRWSNQSGNQRVHTSSSSWHDRKWRLIVFYLHVPRLLYVRSKALCSLERAL
jgi:hypothetical protein